MGSLLSGKRSDRRTTDEAILIRLPELRRAGLLRKGEMTSVRRTWQEAGEAVGEFTITIDLRNFAEPCIYISGDADGCQISQRVLLTGFDQPFGGTRWYVTCPRSASRCQVLALPPGEGVFASIGGWGLAYQSTREPQTLRAHRSARKARERYDGLPKRARWPTRLAAMRSLCELSASVTASEIQQVRKPA